MKIYENLTKAELIEKIIELESKQPVSITYLNRPALQLSDGTILFYARKDLQAGTTRLTGDSRK